jgi:hypothetical protein
VLKRLTSNVRGKVPSIGLALVLGVALILGVNLKEAFPANVCGNIITDTTWTKANSPYLVTCSIFVVSGVTLTIEPGVQVRFQGNYSIDVDGTLVAQGTSGDPIIFTSHTAGSSWGYIYFRDGSTDAVYDADGQYLAGSILQHCVVQYAGAAAVSNNGAIRMNKAHPLIDSCTITSNQSRGIMAWGLTNTLKITNNIISNNKDSGVGGGIWIAQTSYPNPNVSGLSTIYNNIIAFNESDSQGGGVYMGLGGKINLSKNIVNDNKAANGGGLFSEPAGLENHNISGNIFLRNLATNQGGGANRSGQYLNNIFSDNQALYGGAFYNPDGQNLFSHNTFVRNTATYGSTWYFNNNVNAYYNLVAFNMAIGPIPSYNVFLQKNSSTISFSLNSNNFFSNTATYEIYNNSTEGSADVNAENNWWGTAVQAEVEGRIYDFHLNNAKGVVDYIPWSQVIRTDVPISPPQNLAVASGPVKITLTWQANPEGNLAGYKIYWGRSSGYPYDNVIDVGNINTYTFNRQALLAGNTYFAVTAYNTNYSIADPIDPGYVADDPATRINEKQIAGYESWFSPEKSLLTFKTAPSVLLLLLD